MDAQLLRCERLAIDGFSFARGKPKKYSREVIRQDIVQLQLTKDMILDKRLWRIRIRIEG